jgi:hypothetical protein
MPVQDVTAIIPEKYDRILVAVLENSEESSGKLLDLGAPPDKVVTFFAGNNGRKG